MKLTHYKEKKRKKSNKKCIKIIEEKTFDKV